jgi:hypothetical protein
MSTKDQFMQIAAEIVDELQTRARALQPELENIEARKREIEALFHAANLSLKRLSSFQPEIDGNLQCPRCWVHHESRTSILPVPGTDTEDFLNVTSATLSSPCLHNIHPPTGIDPSPCLVLPSPCRRLFAIWATNPARSPFSPAGGSLSERRSAL